MNETESPTEPDEEVLFSFHDDSDQFPDGTFNEDLAYCQEKARQTATLAARTQTALYRDLANVYRLHNKIKSHPVIEKAFQNRAIMNGVEYRRNNPVVALLKLVFCPKYAELVGKERRDAQNKASRYAKIINAAISANVTPDDFVSYARQHGIQRTAIRSASREASGEDVQTGSKHSSGGENQDAQLITQGDRQSSISDPNYFPCIPLGVQIGVTQNAATAFAAHRSQQNANLTCVLSLTAFYKNGRLVIASLNLMAKAKIRPLPKTITPDCMGN